MKLNDTGAISTILSFLDLPSMAHWRLADKASRKSSGIAFRRRFDIGEIAGKSERNTFAAFMFEGRECVFKIFSSSLPIFYIECWVQGRSFRYECVDYVSYHILYFSHPADEPVHNAFVDFVRRNFLEDRPILRWARGGVQSLRMVNPQN
jgi:hypothetical protein